MLTEKMLRLIANDLSCGPQFILVCKEFDAEESAMFLSRSLATSEIRRSRKPFRMVNKQLAAAGAGNSGRNFGKSMNDFLEMFNIKRFAVRHDPATVHPA